MWVVGFGLLAGSGIAELTVDEQLGSKADIHFVNVHPDWLEIQWFGTATSSGKFNQCFLWNKFHSLLFTI